jgi:mRNA interferase MazF
VLFFLIIIKYIYENKVDKTKTMNIYKGDVYWIKLNENIDEKNIPHPHIVIQDTIINQSRIDTIVVCGITTNMRKINWPGNILLEIGEANLT